MDGKGGGENDLVHWRQSSTEKVGPTGSEPRSWRPSFLPSQTRPSHQQKNATYLLSKDAFLIEPLDVYSLSHILLAPPSTTIPSAAILLCLATLRVPETIHHLPRLYASVAPLPLLQEAFHAVA